MMVLAEELAKFTDLIGGPEYIPILLPPLENMAMQEETIVREKVPLAPAALFLWCQRAGALTGVGACQPLGGVAPRRPSSLSAS